MYNREGSFVKRESYAPVKVGDIVEVKIEAVGEKGDGIAKIKGFVLFIPNCFFHSKLFFHFTTGFVY